MTTPYNYGPHRCTCSRTVLQCPACTDYRHKWRRPGGIPRPALNEAEPPGLLVTCSTCEQPFPLRAAQQGALKRGQGLYCSDACRLVQKRAEEQRRRGGGRR